MRILVLGAGVIGSVYAGKLLQAGHDVVMLARGTRLADLRIHGLVLEDAGSNRRMELSVAAVDTVGANPGYDLVMVPVRSEQHEEMLLAVGESLRTSMRAAGGPTPDLDALLTKPDTELL